MHRDPGRQSLWDITRREALSRSALGIGWLAAAALLAEDGACRRPGCQNRKRRAAGFESAGAAFSGELGE